VGWGWARAWEGTKLGQLIQIDCCHISCHMMPCSAIKAQEKEEEGEIMVLMAFVFPSNLSACWGHASEAVAGHLPADGKQ